MIDLNANTAYNIIYKIQKTSMNGRLLKKVMLIYFLK